MRRHERAKEIDVDAVFESIADESLQILSRPQPEVFRHEHAFGGTGLQLLTIAIRQRIRVQHWVGELTVATVLRRHLAEVGQEELIPFAEGPPRGIANAARVAEREVVARGMVV